MAESTVQRKEPVQRSRILSFRAARQKYFSVNHRPRGFAHVCDVCHQSCSFVADRTTLPVGRHGWTERRVQVMLLGAALAPVLLAEPHLGPQESERWRRGEERGEERGGKERKGKEAGGERWRSGDGCLFVGRSPQTKNVVLQKEE